MEAGDRVRTDLVDGQDELEVAGTEPGLELAAEQGAWVRAVRPGVVRQVGVGPVGLIVHGDDENTYFYGHLESVNVHEQQRVTAGWTLGQVGVDPGQRASLWFGVLDPDGQPLDPAGFLTLPVASDVPPAVEPTPASAPGPALLPRTLDDAATLLRDAGFTVEPPRPPAGGGA